MLPKDLIIQKLKDQGCRITKQRLMLLDIILEEECSCCKEIYFKACLRDAKIGTATVYRMVSILEEIGAISRKNMYKVTYDEENKEDHICRIEYEDNTAVELSAKTWHQIIQQGLKAYGLENRQNIRKIIVKHRTHTKTDKISQ